MISASVEPGQRVIGLSAQGRWEPLGKICEVNWNCGGVVSITVWCPRTYRKWRFATANTARMASVRIAGS